MTTDWRQPRTTAPVVLFDFDGVLIRGDSYEHLVRHELTRSRWRLVMMLPVIGVAIPMLKTRVLRSRGQRLMVRCAFLGWSWTRFEASARELGRRLAGDGRLVIREAVERLRLHVAQGARVVVASQSADCVVRVVLDEWGLTGVELVASHPRFGRLGMRSWMDLHGEGKVRRLAELGLHPPWDIAYSDALSDLPMLEGAREPVLVNADEERRADARRALGARVTFVTWR